MLPSLLIEQIRKPKQGSISSVLQFHNDKIQIMQNIHGRENVEQGTPKFISPCTKHVSRVSLLLDISPTIEKYPYRDLSLL